MNLLYPIHTPRIGTAVFLTRMHARKSKVGCARCDCGLHPRGNGICTIACMAPKLCGGATITRFAQQHTAQERAEYALDARFVGAALGIGASWVTLLDELFLQYVMINDDMAISWQTTIWTTLLRAHDAGVDLSAIGTAWIVRVLDHAIAAGHDTQGVVIRARNGIADGWQHDSQVRMFRVTQSLAGVMKLAYYAIAADWTDDAQAEITGDIVRAALCIVAFAQMHQDLLALLHAAAEQKG